jgi:hypothetical protein
MLFSEVIERVKRFILSKPDVLNDTSIWIQGMGWDQTKWPGAKFPTAVRRITNLQVKHHSVLTG